MKINLQNVKAVIFDMDGLLLDTEPWSFFGINAALKTLNYNEISLEQFKQIIGKTSQVINTKLSEWYPAGFDSKAVLELSGEKIRQRRETEAPAIKPGAVELLETLESLKIKKIIASSTSYNQIILNLKTVNLLDKFDNIVGGDQIVNGKPAPDIFLKAAELLETAPQNCLVLEDSVAGSQAAIAAKIPLIIIPDLLEPIPETKEAALACLESLHDVNNLFKAL